MVVYIGSRLLLSLGDLQRLVVLFLTLNGCALFPPSFFLFLFFSVLFFSTLMRARLADVEAYPFTEQAVPDLQA